MVAARLVASEFTVNGDGSRQTDAKTQIKEAGGPQSTSGERNPAMEGSRDRENEREKVRMKVNRSPNQ